MLINKITKLKREFATEGFWKTIGIISARVCDVSDFVALQRDLLVLSPRITCNVKFQLRRLDDEALRSFKDLPYPFSRHYEYRFLYQQRLCYGALIDHEIKALMWPLFRADNHRVVSSWRYLLADEARISSIWVDPAYRGTGLMAACIEKMAEHLRAADFRYLYAFTWKKNVASIRLHEKLGFRVVARVRRFAYHGQKEGKGIYLRGRIARAPIDSHHPDDAFELPEFIL